MFHCWRVTWKNRSLTFSRLKHLQSTRTFNIFQRLEKDNGWNKITLSIGNHNWTRCLPFVNVRVGRGKFTPGGKKKSRHVFFVFLRRRGQLWESMKIWRINDITDGKCKGIHPPKNPYQAGELWWIPTRHISCIVVTPCDPMSGYIMYFFSD